MCASRVVSDTASPYGCSLSSGRLNGQERGFSLCFFDGMTPFVNGEPVGKGKWQLILEQLSTMFGESCFDAPSVDCILAALAQEYAGDVVFVRVGESKLTREDYQRLLGACQDASEKGKRFVVVACAKKEKNPLCCFLVFRGVAFSCWFVEEGEEDPYYYSINLKGVDRVAYKFLNDLATSGGAGIFPHMCCVYNGKEGGSGQWFCVVNLLVLLAEIKKEDVGVIRKGDHPSLAKTLCSRHNRELSVGRELAKDRINEEKTPEVSNAEEARQQLLLSRGREVAMESVVKELRKLPCEDPRAREVVEGSVCIEQVKLQKQTEEMSRLMRLYQCVEMIEDLLSCLDGKQKGDDGVRNMVTLSAECGKLEARLLALMSLIPSWSVDLV